ETFNILSATMLAMQRAVAALSVAPDHVLVDGNRLPDWDYAGRAIIGGDALVPCISAASIIAKQVRDRMMIAADKVHPGYGWARNKGYGAAAHIAAIRHLGPTPLHRPLFLRKILAQSGT
ncbi:MAG: ribonuclease HII, partial [Alphaproteobacteria bacterium]|nr:ribonuclease HII [Alphaproteobacteria bacterium]